VATVHTTRRLGFLTAAPSARLTWLLPPSLTPAQMASVHPKSVALRQSIEVPTDRRGKDKSKRRTSLNIDDMPDSMVDMDGPLGPVEAAGELLDNCDGKHNGTDPMITISSTSKLAGQTVAPFLAKHIPSQYAPLGLGPQPTTSSQKDPNTKYCYRHRPDSKCRRTADEPTMENLQRVCCKD
jgi:F-box/WD-40 domain protein MET30